MKANLPKDEIQKKLASVPYWFHRIPITSEIVTPGVDDSAAKYRWMALPEDLSGLRVLDIGCYEGYFSFECERRGAQVMAVDIIPQSEKAGFRVVHELVGSSVEFQQANIYELTPERFGEFDLVLCLGVLYHLRHPLLGLDRVHSICRGRLILETQICDRYFIDEQGRPSEMLQTVPGLNALPLVQFYPGAELNGDPSNWWSPNVPALHGMLRSSGFEPTRTIENGVRACVHCDKTERPTHTEVAGVFMNP